MRLRQRRISAFSITADQQESRVAHEQHTDMPHRYALFLSFQGEPGMTPDIACLFPLIIPSLQGRLTSTYCAQISDDEVKYVYLRRWRPVIVTFAMRWESFPIPGWNWAGRGTLMALNQTAIERRRGRDGGRGDQAFHCGNQSAGQTPGRH